MQTPKIFEQITGGIASPDTINQWLKTLLPPDANGNEIFSRPSAAWLASVQSVLTGSRTLRHMQIDAIHNTQRRAAQLARTLAHATGPLDAGKAWQQFSQDNLQNTLAYWSAVREILQDTEIRMLNQAEIPVGKTAQDGEAPARLAKPPKRNNAIKARARRKAPARR